MDKSLNNNSKIVEEIPLVSQTLPLIIKRYDFPETLSCIIHNSNDEHFDLHGPHVNSKIFFEKMFYNKRELDWI